jgi:transcriptional regulator with XRE-family HTH domain
MASRARKLNKSVHSTGQSAFCELMIKARKTAGLTQHELAKRLKKPQSFVAKYEGGERRIDIVEFVAICQAIGTDPAGILKTLTKLQSRNFDAVGAPIRDS